MTNSQELRRIFSGQENVYLSVACNDPDTGLWTGKALAVEVSVGDERDLSLSFGCRFGDAWPAVSYGCDRRLQRNVRVAGVRVSTSNHPHTGGNWCWNVWPISVDSAARLVTHRRFTKWFEPEEGNTELWDWWEKFAEVAR